MIHTGSILRNQACAWFKNPLCGIEILSPSWDIYTNLTVLKFYYHLNLANYYSTAQRQLDTHTCAAGWILSGEDYIMSSIFEQVPVMFVPASGKLSGMCTHKHYIILYELINENCNINSVYMMNLRILSLHVLIDPWIHCPTESYLCAVYLIPYCLAGCGEWI